MRSTVYVDNFMIQHYFFSVDRRSTVVMILDMS